MTQAREDVVGLEATIMMSGEIWEASGHTSTLSDLMVDCLLTNKRFRADQIEPQSGIAYFWNGAEDESYEYFLHSEEFKHAIPGWELAVKEDENNRWSSVRTKLVIEHLINSGDAAKIERGKEFLDAAGRVRQSDDKYSVMLPPAQPPWPGEKLA